MQSKNEHSGNITKPVLIKYTALVIALCYLLNPLHQQISTVFHQVSHALEMPSVVIDHNSSSEGNNIHHSHEHAVATDSHEHKLIDIIDAVFDASDSNSHSEDTVTTDFKFDKHITTDYVKFNTSYPIKYPQNFKSLDNNLKIGYTLVAKEPPRKATFPNYI